MAGVWDLGTEERANSSRTPSATIDGYVYAATDSADARAVALAATTNVYHGMLRTAIDLERLTTIDGSEEGDFHVVISYGLAEIPEEGEVRFSASTKGGREKVTLALDTFDEIGIDATHPAADTGGAIGVGADGSVAGVEIVVPQPVFSLEIHVDFSLITNAYWTNLELMTGRTNNAEFYGRDPHEVVFFGADFDGSIRVNSEEQQLARLRFDFGVSKSALYDAADATNFPGVTIPGLQRPISKRGWDYLDVRYGEFVDATSNTKVSRPVMAWARQVLRAHDFGELGIGT
jgi:hypothetical protein